ncbi:AMP-binding protein [Nonomuraea sp. NPDC049129]|uniref:AMP-binding protein n=1 Tax=Nonomuraea sp. NPDC049129 TaxID=3155272 RepID=UPI0033D0DE31
MSGSHGSKARPDGDRVEAPAGSHGPKVGYPDGDRVEVLVARAAAGHPDAPALRWRGAPISYAALLAAAERVAAGLAVRGVRPGDVVAVRLSRGPELVTVLLGVLICGATYAAVPEDWPLPRYRQLAARAGVRVCVTADPEVPGAIQPATLLTDEGRIRAGERGGPGTEACCVFLTSGSSGEPKAVLAPHRGVVRTAYDLPHIPEGPMVTLQAAPVAWDVFALELWVPLIRGGTCVLYEGSHLSSLEIRAALAGGVTSMCVPSAVLNTLAEDDPGCLAGLRLLVTGGERASAKHLEILLRRHPDLRIVNAYGPVENTITTTRWELAGPELPPEIPIGTPAANTSVYLLDDERRPVPDGQVGEIAAAGDGLALGYGGDPEQTARAFPTLTLDGERHRVYLTGDLARRDEQGRLVFVGRRDRQVKIRGVRVEPEEVERAAERIPGITRVSVVAVPAPDGAARLAVFYTPEPGAEITPDAVRASLAAVLPSGFVPDLAVPVEALPMSPNGKVDQEALIALLPSIEPVTGGPSSGPPIGPPSGRPSGTRMGPAGPAVGSAGPVAGTVGPAVGIVCAVAGDLLDRPVAPGDDLFEAGATSLTAIRLANRLLALCAREITGADVLEHRTPKALAVLLDGRPAVAADGAEEIGEPRAWRPEEQERCGPPHVPFPQSGFWHAAQVAPELHETMLPILYRLRGPLDLGKLGAALDAVTARHEALRVRFSAGAAGPVSVLLTPEQTAGLLELDDTSRAGEDALAAARAWALAPFRLAAAIPIRARLFPSADGTWLLAVTVHHIAFDEWSAQVFCRDLARAYSALAGGVTPFDGPPPLYYRTLARQRSREEPRRAAAVRYWRELADGVRDMRFPRTAWLSMQGPAGELPIPLPAALAEAAARAGTAAGGTATAVYAAAYVETLRAYTGTQDLAVTTPVSGRSLPEADDVVGCFASLVPLRLPPSERGPAALVETAARQLRAAMSSPILSVDELMPEVPAEHRRHPLLQAYLQVEELAPERVLTLADDVQAELIDVPLRSVMAEVALHLRPGSGGLLRYRRDAVPDADAAWLADRWLAEVRRMTDT